MARSARVKSAVGMYHIMLRGNGRQEIFRDDADNLFFIDTLAKARAASGFRLHAYCLMGNHAHMLLELDEESPESVLKSIGVRYASYFNKKYGHVGHVFQDRYRSEAISDETYFLTVLRYILNNPVAAGLCKRAEDWPYSSADSYFFGHGISDTEFAESLCGHAELIDYLRTPNEDVCMDDTVGRMPDREAEKRICAAANVSRAEECAALTKAELKPLVERLLSEGLALRQISRLTGITHGVLRGL